MDTVTYLGVIERAPKNYSGFIPDVMGAIGVAGIREETLKSLSEGLALALEDLAERGLPVPVPSDLENLNLDEYEPEEPYEIVSVSPAKMNPVSIEVENALESTGVTRAELARRLGVPRSVVSRITDPFYFGHSVSTLRRVADALGVDLQIRLAASP
ncbi:MAG: type II toxin-antitoxin system HicB family antitoxin [Trueperaceae bacterium]